MISHQPDNPRTESMTPTELASMLAGIDGVRIINRGDSFVIVEMNEFSAFALSQAEPGITIKKKILQASPGVVHH
ncbi:MAG: hypothetical protein KBD17_02125 [Candidatus Pacebacteria bacterium]|nr:hypothetical protein [Candidatus Paceibacterota bacterium]